MRHFYTTKNQNSGFIALISTLILTIVLILVITTAGASGFFARFDSLGNEFKRRSLGLSESCSNAALLKIAQNYNYAPALGGDTVTVGADTCVIKSVTYGTEDPLTHRKLATIQTSALYPLANGSWSINKITATIQNPSLSVATPAPTCSLTASSSPITAGQTVTLQWISAGNATSFNVTRTVGTTTINIGASLPVNGSTSDIPPSSATYAATVSGPGGSTQCVSPQPIVVNPAPDCADTVMVFDRSGSMTSADLANEKTAGNKLIDLYAGVASHPKVSVGSFGGYPNNNSNPASIPTSPNGQLQNIYTTLKNTLSTILGSNSSVGSDLSAAITVGNNELNSSRHTPGFQKVLLLVSDGEPNKPSGDVNADAQSALSASDTAKLGGTNIFTIHYGASTGRTFLAQLATGTTAYPIGGAGPVTPSTDAQNASGDAWTTPAGAYGAGTATTVNNANKKHRYYNFGIPTIPSGTTINDVIVKTTAWVTDLFVNSGFVSPTGSTAPSQWTNSNNAFSSNNVYATNSVNGQQQGYNNFNFSIPSSASIQGIQVSVEAKVASTPTTTATLFPNGQGNYKDWSGSESNVNETGTPDCASAIDSSRNNDRESVKINLLSIPDGSTVTDVTVYTWDQGSPSGNNNRYQTFTRVGTTTTDSGTNISTTSTTGCTPRSQNINIIDFVKSASSTLEVGVLKVGNTNTKVGTIRATVGYLPPATGSLAIALSPNNGTTWSTSESVPLSGTEAVLVPTGNSATDLWGTLWSGSSFTNGNFTLRVHNTSATGATVSLDQVQVKVNYTAAPSTACSLGVDLSWNGGSNWTTEQQAILPQSSSTQTFNTAGGWGSHVWASLDFTNTNFRARVHAIDGGANCDNAAVTNLDTLMIQLVYGANHQPGSANDQATPALENTDGDNFFIAPTSSDMVGIFDTIGKKVCPAAVPPPPPNPPPTPPPPPPPPPPLSIGTWDEIINVVP